MSTSQSNPIVLQAILDRPRMSFLDETVALLRGLGIFSVPDGYEDEAGFHFDENRTHSHAPHSSPVFAGENI